MKNRTNRIFYIFLLTITGFVYSQDWEGIPVPANAGTGKKWELQQDVSDDFNYSQNPSTTRTYFGNRNGNEGQSAENTTKFKWYNYYHANWEGPGPTKWRHENVSVADGNLRLKTTRIENETKTFSFNNENVTKPATRLGCVTSTKQVQYPVFIETRVKIPNAVLACAMWLLSPDDTQEIDFLEAYGGRAERNKWFAERLHFSHHVFIRQPFTDYQPKDDSTWYRDPNVDYWSSDWHRIGGYWKSPTELEYYLDGQLVKTTEGMDNTLNPDGTVKKYGIDPVNHTSPDGTPENRTGLNKAMDIIINMEDQNWNAVAGRSPTDEEIQNEEDHTMKVDWIRVYKPVDADGTNNNRERNIEFQNKNSFVPTGATLPEFKEGQAFEITLNYATKIENNEEEDLNYIATHVRQLDENGAVVSVSPFQAFVNDNAPNANITSYQFIMPTHFDAEKINPIPTSDKLPQGHKLQLLIYMSYDNNPNAIEGNLTFDANTDFTLVANDVLSTNEFIKNPFTIFPNPTDNIFYLEGLNFGFWEIYDLNGKMLDSGTKNKIKTDSLSNGMYIVKVDNKYHLKLVKK